MSCENWDLYMKGESHHLFPFAIILREFTICASRHAGSVRLGISVLAAGLVWLVQSYRNLSNKNCLVGLGFS
ncbi:hypothetical protein Bca4012_049691 [Brassica carinata]|uniref:Uncharacterized protein n=1 Tax=Brassica oleracea TaxID=3712 RepID=A0A3P6DG01_BRAOL|nr:unnamed protein product [Brassica oleracea]